VGLDLNLPVGTSLARAGCDPASAPDSAAAAWLAAAWLAAAGWVMRLMAWAFAALFIAEFSEDRNTCLVNRRRLTSLRVIIIHVTAYLACSST